MNNDTENPRTSRGTREFLLQRPEKMPKIGDIFYRYTSNLEENFDTAEGFIYLTKEKNDEKLSGVLPGINRQFLTTVKVKKSFTPNNLARYGDNGQRKGWGATLNRLGTDIQWIAVSTLIVDEHLEITNSERINQPPKKNKLNKRQIEVLKRTSTSFLNYFLEGHEKIKKPSYDEKQITHIIIELEKNELLGEYDIEHLRQRYKELSWNWPLD